MNLPPPMPDWTSLISNLPPVPEVITIPREDLPCNACGENHRVVYKSGVVDAYCKACRKAKNHRSYLERKNRDIRIGSPARDFSTPGAPGGMALRRTEKHDIAEVMH